mmetsp:Transcript_106076/g.253191  ORF Transcript_106076/g.253191 Transcript_106076/m.253191 type:complete len:243 (+) Transcript_106076:205-933(+)
MASAASGAAAAPGRPARHLAVLAAAGVLMALPALRGGALTALPGRGPEIGDLPGPRLLAHPTGDGAVAPLGPLGLFAVGGGAIAQVAACGLDELAGAQLPPVRREGDDLPLSLHLACATAAVARAPLHPRRHLAVHLSEVAGFRLQQVPLAARAPVDGRVQHVPLPVPKARLIAVAPLTPLAQDTVHWLLEVVGAISGAWLDLLQLVLTPLTAHRDSEHHPIAGLPAPSAALAAAGPIGPGA